MRDIIEGATSYLVGLLVLVLAFTVDHASMIMKIGGVLLLAVRLYADGMRAYKTWKGEL